MIAPLLSLLLLAATDATQTVRFESYATVHSIGVEWHITGDANHNAACRVRYRAQGEDAWRDAMPLLRIDYAWWYHKDKADAPTNMLAGSLFFLEPGTTYELQLTRTDPDGGDATKTLTVATRPIPALPTRGRTREIGPDGLKAAQKAAQPGDVFLLRSGQYGVLSLNRAGAPGKYIAWKAAPGAEVRVEGVNVNASHVWIEGMQMTHREYAPGVRGQANTTDVVIQRNTFNGFHYTIVPHGSSRAWHITDNVIVGDNDPGLTGRQSMSGEGIELNFSRDHVVAYNRISRVADGISYPHTNCDIYGNDIFDVSDDGIEPDYGWSNIRIWGNRIYNYQHAALSFQPMKSGPWYFIRNQIIGTGEIFKLRVQDRFVLINNTFVRWNGIDPQMRMHHLLTAMTRNNLFISLGDEKPVWGAVDCNAPQYCLPNIYTTNWKTDVDHDGFDWGNAKRAFRWANSEQYADLATFSSAVGIEQNGVRVHRDRIFEQLEMPAAPGPTRPQVLTLKRGCSAVDAGVALPNILEQFIGKAPDLGAHELGAAPAQYGPRP